MTLRQNCGTRYCCSGFQIDVLEESTERKMTESRARGERARSLVLRMTVVHGARRKLDPARESMSQLRSTAPAALAFAFVKWPSRFGRASIGRTIQSYKLYKVQWTSLRATRSQQQRTRDNSSSFQIEHSCLHTTEHNGCPKYQDSRRHTCR